MRYKLELTQLIQKLPKTTDPFSSVPVTLQ